MNARLVTFCMYLAGLIAIADQGTKWWIINDVMQNKDVVRVNDFFNLVLTLNKGITFGLFGKIPYMSYVFVVTAVAILLLLVNWLIKTSSTIVGVGLSLVIGGALGNIIDRVNLGGVIDFLDFHVGTYHWPAFNLADSAIVCGVGILLLEHLVRSPKKG